MTDEITLDQYISYNEKKKKYYCNTCLKYISIITINKHIFSKLHKSKIYQKNMIINNLFDIMNNNSDGEIILRFD